MFGRRPEEENVADTRLIGAAPELMEALRAALEATDARQVWFEQAEAAIAKAIVGPRNE